MLYLGNDWRSASHLFQISVTSSQMFFCFVFLSRSFSKKIEDDTEWKNSPMGKFYAFEGFSLVFPEDALPKLLSSEDTETDSLISEKEATNQIIRAFDIETKFTRADIGKLYQHSLSVRGFGRAWDAAREQLPDLGKPGRKSAAGN